MLQLDYSVVCVSQWEQQQQQQQVNYKLRLSISYQSYGTV